MIKKLTIGYKHRHLESLNFDRILPNIIAGLLIGVEEIVFAISIGSLVFSGELVPYLPYGISIALVSAAITMVSISFLSSLNGVIGSLQDSPCVIVAVIASSLVGGLMAASTEVKFATVSIIIAISTILTGLLFLVLGHCKLGELVRFIPYPVVGGFLAGTGWLLIQGSIQVMTDYPLTISNLNMVLQPTGLILWIPGALFGLLLFFCLRRIHNYWIMPSLLIGSILVFYLVLLVTSTPVEEAIQRGFLISTKLNNVKWSPLQYRSLMVASWPAILKQAGNLIVIPILSVIGLLINTSALELYLGQDTDLDHELKTAGIANLLSGLAGGMVGYHTLNVSALSIRLGTRSRVVGILAGGLCLIVLLTGVSWLLFFPKFILGGLIFFLGLEFIYDWVIAGWSKLSKTDYLVVILILGVLVTTNFVIGMTVGLAAMILLFIINYSRVKVIRRTLSGIELSSNVERNERELHTLKEFGDQIQIFELQGYIFFGTAYTLLRQVRTQLVDKNRSGIRYMILDLRGVSGLDSSAIFIFSKCRQVCEDLGVELILTGASDSLHDQLETGGFIKTLNKIHLFPDLDRGMEWCEEKLLKKLGVSKTTVPTSMHERLVSAGFQEIDAARLVNRLEQVEFDQGESLAHQGEKANDLFFIEHGKLSIYLELENKKRIRLQTLDMRALVGELGLYLGTTRSASIIADEPSVAYRLSKSAQVEIKQKDPDLAIALHEYVARTLAERLAETTKMVAKLSA